MRRAVLKNVRQLFKKLADGKRIVRQFFKHHFMNHSRLPARKQTIVQVTVKFCDRCYLTKCHLIPQLQYWHLSFWYDFRPDGLPSHFSC